MSLTQSFASPEEFKLGSAQGEVCETDVQFQERLLDRVQAWMESGRAQMVETLNGLPGGGKTDATQLSVEALAEQFGADHVVTIEVDDYVATERGSRARRELVQSKEHYMENVLNTRQLLRIIREVYKLDERSGWLHNGFVYKDGKIVDGGKRGVLPGRKALVVSGIHADHFVREALGPEAVDAVNVFNYSPADMALMSAVGRDIKKGHDPHFITDFRRREFSYLLPEMVASLKGADIVRDNTKNVTRWAGGSFYYPQSHLSSNQTQDLREPLPDQML